MRRQLLPDRLRLFHNQRHCLIPSGFCEYPISADQRMGQSILMMYSCPRIQAFRTQTAFVDAINRASPNANYFAVLDSNIAAAAITGESPSVLIQQQHVSKPKLPAHDACALHPTIRRLRCVFIRSARPFMLVGSPGAIYILNGIPRLSPVDSIARKCHC